MFVNQYHSLFNFKLQLFIQCVTPKKKPVEIKNTTCHTPMRRLIKSGCLLLTWITLTDLFWSQSHWRLNPFSIQHLMTIIPYTWSHIPLCHSPFFPLTYIKSCPIKLNTPRLEGRTCSRSEDKIVFNLSPMCHLLIDINLLQVHHHWLYSSTASSFLFICWLSFCNKLIKVRPLLSL